MAERPARRMTCASHKSARISAFISAIRLAGFGQVVLLYVWVAIKGSQQKTHGSKHSMQLPILLTHRESRSKRVVHTSVGFLCICEIPCFSFHPVVSRGNARPQEPVAGLAEQRTGPDGRLVAATTWIETPIYIET